MLGCKHRALCFLLQRIAEQQDARGAGERCQIGSAEILLPAVVDHRDAASINAVQDDGRKPVVTRGFPVEIQCTGSAVGVDQGRLGGICAAII